VTTEGIVNIHGIDGQDGYFVSEDGRVFREKKICVNPVSGYEWVSFRRGDRGRYVHEIVLTTFAGERPDNHQASHLNGVRRDNRLENLAWETPATNTGRQAEHGTKQLGEGHYASVLTEWEVLYIRSRKNTGYGFFKALSKQIGKSVNTVRDAYYGKTWRHI
jgi:hypothetical protein